MAELSMMTTDPFFHLSRETAGLREKVSDSIFENYKLQVAQTNDINNRAMQVALHNTTALSDLKGAVSKGTLETMLAAERTASAIGQTSAAIQRSIADAAITQQRVTMEQAEITRNLINGLNTQNLNTALINTNTALTGIGGQYAGLGLAYGGAVSAFQSANQVNAVNALGSAVSNQRQNVIGTGATGGAQVSTPTSV
jgi:DNA uptake protein ComE-like DNA-binding protein